MKQDIRSTLASFNAPVRWRIRQIRALGRTPETLGNFMRALAIRASRFHDLTDAEREQLRA